MSGRRPGAGFLKTALLVAMLAGCAGGGSQERALDSYTAEEIYKKGELELETGKKPKDALIYFQEVERLYPYTEFAKRAQDGKLTIEELSGGTFSITNGGVFGSMLSTPIINPPRIVMVLAITARSGTARVVAGIRGTER